MSAIAIRFPFTMRMSVAHKGEVEQTVCGREVVRGTCTQLSAGRVGAAASPGQGREPGNSLSQGSWLSLCPSICGHLGSTHGGHALYQEVQELKTLQLPSGSLWAAEKSLLRREAIAQVLREAYGQAGVVGEVRPLSAGVVLGRRPKGSRIDASFEEWLRFCWAKRKKVGVEAGV